MLSRVPIGRYLWIGVAAAVALVVNTYAYAHHYISTRPSDGLSIATDECVNPSATPENPNRMLFISCGGLIE